MTKQQQQIVELVKAVGQEGAEDALLSMGLAATYGQARSLITKAKKSAR